MHLWHFLWTYIWFITDFNHIFYSRWAISSAREEQCSKPRVIDTYFFNMPSSIFYASFRIVYTSSVILPSCQSFLLLLRSCYNWTIICYIYMSSNRSQSNVCQRDIYEYRYTLFLWRKLTLRMKSCKINVHLSVFEDVIYILSRNVDLIN